MSAARRVALEWGDRAASARAGPRVRPGRPARASVAIASESTNRLRRPWARKRTFVSSIGSAPDQIEYRQPRSASNHPVQLRTTATSGLCNMSAGLTSTTSTVPLR